MRRMRYHYNLSVWNTCMVLCSSGWVTASQGLPATTEECIAGSAEDWTFAMCLYGTYY